MKEEKDVEEEETGKISTGTSTDATIPYGSARASRNLAEKQRRDNLNNNIAMMAALVPTIIGSSRRQDKISILRLAGAYLRTNFTIGPGIPQFLPSKYDDIDLEDNFIDASEGNGGFLIVVTTTGNIVYVGRRIESQLGHIPMELIGRSLYSYIHQDDHDELTKALTPDDTFPEITDVNHTDQNSNSSDDVIPLKNNKYISFNDQRRNFNIKLAQRTNSRNEHTQFKYFCVSGVLKLADYCKKKMNRNRNITSNDIVFIGIARMMQKRITELSLFEANKQEYVTRHLLDGRIVFSDHRIAVVAGYMTEEVSGTNAFSFMHKEDVRYTVMALKQMYDQRQGYGASCYRLLSKSGAFIYLRTHGYLELDKKAGTFESFICVNTLVEKEEGDALIKELKERFSAVTSKEDTPIENESLPSPDSHSNVEDPTQLEDVISQLINDLPSPVPSDDQNVLSPAPDIQYAKAAIYSQQMPPISVQSNKIGIANLEIPSNGKHNNSLVETSNQSLHDETSTSERNKIVNVDISNNDNEDYADDSLSIISESITIDNEHSKDVLFQSKQLTSKSNRKYITRGKNLYELSSNTTLINKNCTELRPTVVCTTHKIDKSSDTTIYSATPTKIQNDNCNENHAGKVLITLRNEIMNHDTEQQGLKRPLEDDNYTKFDKKQRNSFHINKEKSTNPSIQNMMENNPDFLKMIDELGEVIKSDANTSEATIMNFPNHQVDRTLRQTYSRLKDHINYQGTQINELELVFDNENLYAQRENLEQLQAEHEIQKEMIKTLQQDHHSIQVNVTKNIGV
ncbi:hypothetical protein PV328_002035 [Microctonus aethiopoides]|uniref:Uncharacterized protein n=1 Tax=Microctonus aethiopoides TaxID=144406 RepID=A0AA39FY85_9HYME|nr:hypothetical protein PV328_002035 [Microctonus aethiopoides]